MQVTKQCGVDVQQCLGKQVEKLAKQVMSKTKKNYEKQ